MSSQIPVSKIHDWLRKSLSSKLTQTERERDKILSEIARALQTLPEFCGQLSRKAEDEMETKRDNRAQYRAAKAVVRLTSIISNLCKSIEIPSSKDSVTLRSLQRETAKAASEAARARQEWLRQIRPYYIIDMMTLGGNIDKIRRLGDELHTFLIGDGSLIRSFEELDEKLAALSKIQLAKQSASSQRKSVEERVTQAEAEEASLRGQVEKIRENEKMKGYVQIDSELKALRGELLRTGFSRLGRPLRKMISVSERGDYPLSLDVREKAKEYARKPFTTFLKEEEGYPHLKAVMGALSKGVSSGKLALKQREAKKVVERTEQVVDGGSLAGILEKSKELKGRYDQFMADPENAGLVRQVKDLRQKGRANHAQQKELKAELERALGNEGRLEEQIAQILGDIESFSRKLSGTAVKLQMA